MKNEAQILARLIKAGISSEDAELQAQIQAAKNAPRLAKRAARKAAAIKFGKRAATGSMPRIQIKAAAGLGKTVAVVEEYIRRPSLWSRNVAIYVRDLALAEDLALSIREAAVAIKSNQNKHRPRAVVIRGEDKRWNMSPRTIEGC